MTKMETLASNKRAAREHRAALSCAYRHCERSEAIHLCRVLDCFVAPAQNCFAILSRAPRNDESRQNIRLSFTSTQRPFLICWIWVMVLARWSVLENLVGGELKMSRNLSPDSSASSIFWPVRSLPALLA